MSKSIYISEHNCRHLLTCGDEMGVKLFSESQLVDWG